MGREGRVGPVDAVDIGTEVDTGQERVEGEEWMEGDRVGRGRGMITESPNRWIWSGNKERGGREGGYRETE